MSGAILLEQFDRLAEAPDGVRRLRRFILDLAVRGKLVEQDPSDGQALHLLSKIQQEKYRLAEAGFAKKDRPLPEVRAEEIPFSVPDSWAWTRLQNIASYIQRGKSPSYAAEGGVPVISQRCVQWRGLDLKAARRITKESLEKYEAVRFLQEGDLLWNSTGTGTIGRIVRVIAITQGLTCDSHVTVVRCALVSPEYVRSWLASDHVYGSIEDRASGATNQVELNSSMAALQIVPLPPLAEQHRIVAKVAELMVLCDQFEAAQQERERRRDRLAGASLHRLNQLAADTTFEAQREHVSFHLENFPRITAGLDHVKGFRQAIFDLAIRGKLVPQDGSDEPAIKVLERVARSRDQALASGDARKKKPVKPAEVNPGSIPRGWGVQALGNLVDPVNTISYGVLVPGPEVENGIPFVRVQDLALAEHPPRPNKSIAPEIEASYSRTRLKGGEILLCVVGATIGKLGIVPPSWAGANIARAVCRILPMPGLNTQYLLILLQSAAVQGYFADSTRTLAQPTLNVGMIEQLAILVPPIAEQARIVAKVDELLDLCDQLEAQLITALTQGGRLLETVLQSALNGEPATLSA